MHNPTTNPPMDALNDAGPALRLRFDPPPEPASPELGNVLSEVDQIAQGIDTMLRRASNSSVGSPVLAADGDEMTDRADEAGADDDAMMAMYDEDEPSELLAMDRLLASQADDLLAGTAAAATDSTVPEEPEIVLEGEFESVESLIATPATSSALSASPASLSPIIAPTASAGMGIPGGAPAIISAAPKLAEGFPANASASMAAIAEPFSHANVADRSIAVAFDPQPSLAHSQAAGLAAAVEAATAANQKPVETWPAPRMPAEPVSTLSGPEFRRIIPPEATATTDSQAIGDAMSLPNAWSTGPIADPAVNPLPMVHPAPVASSVAPAIGPTAAPVGRNIGAPVASESAAPARSIVKAMSASIRTQVHGVVTLIALSNLPLRLLPASLRPAVNVLAISLALWAPAVWALGPKVAAARQAANTLNSSSVPGHAESSLKDEATHGGADAGGGHDDGGHDAKKTTTERKASSSKKPPAKKSSAKKSGAAASAGAHH